MLTADRLCLNASGLECPQWSLQARLFARLHGLDQSEMQERMATAEIDGDDVAAAYDVILGR
jgi:hypothetical protein